MHGGSATQSLFHMPNRRRVPQILYNPSSKWDDQIGRLAHTHGIILFDHKGHSKQGMKIMELYSAGTRSSMAGAGDRVLASTGLQRITLYIRVCLNLIPLARIRTKQRIFSISGQAMKSGYAL